MKKIISIILAVIMISGCALISDAADTSAKLYGTYGDGMLFQQNKDAVFAGIAPSGAVISAELYGKDGNIVASGESTASADGTFEVSFAAPEGGYNEYIVILKENSAEFERLENIVFGELWLSSGQSNMQYPLSQDKDGAEMFSDSEKLSKWLRVLLVPAYCEDIVEKTYADPQQDIMGAKWVTGENPAVYSMSAVAYHFAAKLMDELDMPVGILNASLGGSAIESWLSREAIDGDDAVRNSLVSRKRYIERSDWSESKQNIYVDMTANYNHKIEALRHFNPSGMIWYQGETDLSSGVSHADYGAMYDLMQRSYSELFGYENELMPFICTQLAAYLYSDEGYNLIDWNINYCKIQAAQPDSRAVVAIYDVPLTYIPEAGPIHPECKKEIGERMAFAAKGLVYGEGDVYTAATVKKAEIRDGSVYVTLENTGSGIYCGGDELYGFAVCGAGGVYVQADAEITASDTVRVWSDSVENPVSASYAYCVSNMRSNLYAASDMPVSPFVTDKSVGTHYWADRSWTDCGDEYTWHVMRGIELNKDYSSWRSEGAELTFESGIMNVSSEAEFTLSPVLNYEKNSKFDDTDNDYSDYGKMSVLIRNNGSEPVEIGSVKIYKSDFIWYSPAADGTRGVEASIPADGQWHTVTFDLNRLYLFGNEGGAGSPCRRLGKVTEIRFEFVNTESTDISIDSIRFAPDTSDGRIHFDPDESTLDTFAEKLTAIFTKALGLIISVFR
ncbi:MAG: hypothetical protein IKU08_08555 [Clostridia bacterium]|nr:hypothetical protein [Clostridia bacterium]